MKAILWRALTVSICVSALSAACEVFAYGELDNSYKASFPAGWTAVNALTPLPDDSVLVGLAKNAATPISYAVAKVRPDGKLDAAWQGGIAVLGGIDPNAPASILPLPDGGAIVSTGLSLTRLHSDGSVDTSYGTAGHYGSALADIQSVAVASDGSAFVLSRQAIPLGAVISRFTHILANGALDLNFGASGYLQILDPTLTGQTIYAWSMKDDGTVEVGYNDNGLPPRPVLRRFPVDFTDTDRPRGRVMPRAGIASWSSRDVLVDGAGGAVFGVAAKSSDGWGQVYLQRFLPDGSVDPGFGLTPVTVMPLSRSPDAIRIIRGPDGHWTVFVSVLTTTYMGWVPIPLQLENAFAERFGVDGKPFGAQNEPLPIVDLDAFIQLNTGKMIVPVAGTLARYLTDDEPRVDGILIEYYHPSLRHYFLTLDTFEAAILDSNPGGWIRTGRTFPAWQPVAAPATTAVCRFYGDPVIGPNSHFYTPEGRECDGLVALQESTPPGVPVWHLEGKPFRVSLPSADGACPGNLDPVYRVFNGLVDNGHGPAHRYTTDPALYGQMQSLGWIPEGAHFCVPPQGPR